MKFKSLFFSIFLILIIALTISCGKDEFPKPKSYLHLEYPEGAFHRFVNACPYSFAISKESNITFDLNCNAVVSYPKMKAKVHITYVPVKNNLNELLSDADKLTTKHTIKADAIYPHPFANEKNKVFGILNEVQGAGASNVQFYVTDSLNHLLTAALYFKVQPNYDSLYPAIQYLKNDMMQMMETLEWK